MRVVATALLIVLSGLVIPRANVPYPLVKISLLIAAELGLVCLMLGMFLRSKTYFAGVQLCLGSLIMLWLAGKQLTYVAAAVGGMFIALGVAELVTRRSRLNGLLGLSSFHGPSEEATLLEEALSPEAVELTAPPAVAAKTQTNGRGK